MLPEQKCHLQKVAGTQKDRREAEFPRPRAPRSGCIGFTRAAAGKVWGLCGELGSSCLAEGDTVEKDVGWGPAARQEAFPQPHRVPTCPLAGGPCGPGPQGHWWALPGWGTRGVWRLVQEAAVRSFGSGRTLS